MIIQLGKPLRLLIRRKYLKKDIYEIFEICAKKVGSVGTKLINYQLIVDLN